MIVTKKIKATTDFLLNTYIESHDFIKDEVAFVKFKNESEFKALLRSGHFIEAGVNESVHKSIPIIGKGD